MVNNEDLLKRIKAIERRNSSVSIDKRWETSWTRRVSIAMLTYGVVLTYLFIIQNESPWINALVPVGGFLLSTLALGWVRIAWQRSK